MLKIPARFVGAVVLAACFLIAGCSPKFNWRDYRSPDAPYTAMFPAKPSNFTRPVNLDGVTVNMTMTAAEVDGVTFAIGNAEMHDAAQAKHALTAIKTALVKNINGKVKSEKTAEAASSSGSTTRQQSSVEVEAEGTQNGHAMVLHGRFIAQDTRVYEVIVVGRQDNISAESVKTFMDAFKSN